MTRSTVSPILSKHNRTSVKEKGKHRSSIADELFRKNRRPAPLSGKQKTSPHPLHPLSMNLNPSGLRTSAKQRARPQVHKHRGCEHEHSDDELDTTFNESRQLGRYEAEYNEDDIASSCSEPGDSDEEDEEDWRDGSTLLAPYRDEESETEEDRAIALVEYLQVPMQEKSHSLKQDICNALTATINDIRQAQDKVERGADVDRGKGIVRFNDACDKRHVDASHLHAELQDSMADNQAEIKKLFMDLKQAYNRRDQLWVDLKANIAEITDNQAAGLSQLEDNMARTVAALEKKGKTLFKEDSAKDKEKLLRGFLGNL